LSLRSLRTPPAEGAANDQQIAIFFITLALAILADLKRSMYHPDARRYYHLSRASISLSEDIFQSRSLYAIQYLVCLLFISSPSSDIRLQQLLATYNGMTNDPNGTNRAWGAMGLAIRLAQMVGFKLALRLKLTPNY
ncbi:9003_t:CDS:2, partial [Acaulospora colombiana]